MSDTPSTPPAPSPLTDDGEVLLKLNTRNLPPEVLRDLEANAHLQRTTPAGLIARLLNTKLAPAGISLEAA